MSVTIDGKGGGKDNSAQAIGININKLKDAVEVARQYASSCLWMSYELIDVQYERILITLNCIVICFIRFS